MVLKAAVTVSMLLGAISACAAGEPQSVAVQQGPKPGGGCPSVEFVIDVISKLGARRWSEPWTAEQLRSVFGSQGDVLREDSGRLMAYEWNYERRTADSLRCTIAVMPGEAQKIERVTVLYFNRSRSRLAEAGAAFVRAFRIPGGSQFEDVRNWSDSTSKEKWRELDHWPKGLEDTKGLSGTLDLHLDPIDGHWQLGVGYGEGRQ